MKITEKQPPRKFEAGFGEKVQMLDCGTVELASDEQITFLTQERAEYDVVRKEWGFYATPSTNGRLIRFGLRAALVKNLAERWYVVLVETDKQELFQQYCDTENLVVIAWLDDGPTLKKLAKQGSILVE
ncbi:MAG TPA: hypothetical protein VJC05_04380 [Candidatus Andersenbacteria bacterium]|nr:MAG: hypothetical protein A2854_04740 [Parcubacteria group bacterium RIFCSPHIGHO2_01_FULL_56_18]HLD26250.1 hypothetical protein [Candidatus Andersenbacteria bacterium]